MVNKEEFNTYKGEVNVKLNDINGKIFDTNNKLKLIIPQTKERLDSLEKDKKQLRKDLNELMSVVVNLKNTISVLESEISQKNILFGELTKKADEANDKVVQLEKENKKLALELGESLKNFEVELVRARNKEELEKKKKETNIIIFGLANGDSETDEKKRLSDILKTIKIEFSSVKRRVRLGKQNTSDKPAPVLVEFNDKETRDTALARQIPRI